MPPVTLNLKNSQAKIKKIIREIYDLFCNEFHFYVQFNVETFFKRKLSSFSLETKLLQQSKQNEDMTMIKNALKVQKENLILIIDEVLII